MRGEHTPQVSPDQAAFWIEQWQKIGGGITIALGGAVSPWRVQPAGLDRDTVIRADELQRSLLRELDETPGMQAGVRTLITLEAHRRARRGIRGLGGEG